MNRKRKNAVSAAGLTLLLAATSVAQAQDQNASQDSRYEIRLLQESFTPPQQIDTKGLEKLALEKTQRGNLHLLVQLHEIPDEAQRNDLWRRGLDLGAYVSGSAWIAAVPATQLKSLNQFSEVRWLTPWTPERKLHPRVKKGEWGSWTRDPSQPGWVMLMVQLHHDVDLTQGERIAEQVGGVAMPPIEGLHGMTLWVPESKVSELAKIEEVLWIEEGPMPLSPNNDGVRANTRADAVINAPYGLDGTGVRLFVFDGGTVRATHQTFNPGTGSRVTVIDAQPAADHPTHVAGTAAGDGSGSTGTRARGVAQEATIFSAAYEQTGGTMLFWDNAGDIQADYALARNTYNADLGTNSIGSNTASNGYDCAREGDYGVSSNLLDGIVRGSNATVGSAVIMTWANGNERSGGSPKARCGANYVTTAPPSCAKNPIHIGAINSDGGSMTNFSSWGPCDDGRLKPIVSAPGCETGRVSGEAFIYSSLNTSDSAYGGSGWCGTSMATPAVGGIVSLFIEDWRARGFGGATARPLPALVKAFLIHTARDQGQDGPDFIYGYGAVDAKALIDTMRAGTGTLGAAGATVWGTDSVTNAAVDNFTINVPAGTGVLKASLAWDDAAAAAFSASAPVNNLTLQLISPSATTVNAWVLSAANPHLPATTGLNSLDNQEQVVVENPAAGNWTVRVTGTSVPTSPQTYGLVYSTTAAAGGTCTPTTAGFEAGNDSFTLTGAARVAAPATGHGSWSLRLGGAASTTHEATRDFAIPAGATRAELTYWWYMTTDESAAGGFGWDFFDTEIRNTSGTVLAVVDHRSDGWREAAWMQQQNIDLTPWAGTTVRVAFRATNDSSLVTSFYVDDFDLTTCSGGVVPVTVTFTSTASEDGRLWESTETSNVGGGGNSTDNTTASLRVGDFSDDTQYKTLVSFDTSSIPDTATIQSATLRLKRGTVSGTSPFSTHGTCTVDIRNGGFGGWTAFAAGDFEAAATASGVASMSNATTDGTFSTGTLNASGLSAINKTGVTQLKVYFTTDDNDDLGTDYMGFYSGEAAAGNRPELVVTYLP